MSAAIIWFRRDLRLIDSPALDAACAAHDRVLPVYIHALHEAARWSPGAASSWWLHRSLQSLNASLNAQGGALQIGQGGSLEILRRWIAETGADAVYWNRQYEPAAIAGDAAVKAALRAEGVAVYSQPGNLWCEPWRIATAEGQPYRVFTPYWRKLRTLITPEKPLPQAHACEWVRVSGSVPLETLRLNRSASGHRRAICPYRRTDIALSQVLFRAVERQRDSTMTRNCATGKLPRKRWN